MVGDSAPLTALLFGWFHLFRGYQGLGIVGPGDRSFIGPGRGGFRCLSAIPSKVPKLADKRFAHALTIARLIEGPPKDLNLARCFAVFVVMDLTGNGYACLVENLYTPLKITLRALITLLSLCEREAWKNCGQ